MAINGNLFTNYLREVYLPQAISTIFFNDAWFSQPFFEIVPSASCPAGPHINTVIDYAVDSNAEVYVQGAPMPSASTLSDVRAYFTKDFYQETAKVYGDTLAMSKNGGLNVQEDLIKKSLDTAIKNLKVAMTTTFTTDLAAQVDSSTAYSDASLNRTTYSIASYEYAVSGALTRAWLTDVIEFLQTGSYGMPVDISDLCFVVPPNQHTNIANLQAAAQYAEFSVDAQNMGPMDTGVKFRTMTYESVPILQIPGLTTTEVYLLKRSATKIYMHEDITAQPKDIAEWADNWLVTGGANLVVSDPRACVKLTGVTA
jgi:hypothetical protein